jgi:hypothetical protein
MAKETVQPKTSSATLGFESKLWEAANALRGSMDAAEYKHVVLGLIFLKYISDAKVIFVPQRSSHHPQAHLRRLRGAPRQAGRPNATRASVLRTPTSLPAPSEAPACAGTADRRRAESIFWSHPRATPTSPGFSTSSITSHPRVSPASSWPTAPCPPISRVRGRSAM